MTTRDGASSTRIPSNPSWRIGVTANKAFMEFQTAQTNPATVAQPITAPGEETHNISLGEIVCTTNATMLKRLGFVQPTNELYGKPPVIGQSGGVPHGLPEEFLANSPYWQALSADDKNRLLRLSMMKYFDPMGVSLGNFRLSGSGKTPLQDGIDILISGPVTMSLFTGTILPPMTRFRVVPMPASKMGRSGGQVKFTWNGSQRFPFTVEPVDNKSVGDILRTDVAFFSERILAKKNDKAGTNLFYEQVVKSTARESPMLEGDRNASNLLAGLIGAAMIIMEEVTGEKGDAVRDQFAALFGSKSGEAGRTTMMNIAARLAGRNNKPVGGAMPTDDQKAMTSLSRSALALISGAVQDTAAIINRSQGRIIQHQPSPNGYNASVTGEFTYDTLWGM
jgi:hypothetical protein